MRHFTNYDGKRFNNYIVIKREYKDDKGDYWFLCKCDCGNEFMTRGMQLGRVKSCGCMTRKLISDSKRIYNKEDRRLYNVWLSMKNRCYKETYQCYSNYGGRGITVCEEWAKDFNSFRKWAMEHGYMKDAKKRECTLDRIDVNGNYEPDNCRWVNMKIQNSNKRNNRFVTYNGETHTISEWGRITDININTLYHRLTNNWNIEDALTNKDNLYKKISKRKMIINYMKEHGSITEKQAFEELNIRHLSKRISELRRQHIPIKTVVTTKNNNIGKKTTVTTYVLDEE